MIGNEYFDPLELDVTTEVRIDLEQQPDMWILNIPYHWSDLYSNTFEFRSFYLNKKVKKEKDPLIDYVTRFKINFDYKQT